MELVNNLYAFNIKISELSQERKAVIKEAIETTIKLLNPIAPHFCEELWHEIGNSESIYLEPWPKYSIEDLKEDEITVVVQINGKLRDKIKVLSDISEADIREKIIELPKVKKWINDRKIVKIIYVAGKLVNIVVK